MKKVMIVSAVVGLLAAGLWLVGVASAQDPVEVAVTLNEFTVSMSTTSVPANTPVKFVVTNQGKIEHEVVLEKAGALDAPLELHCGGGDCAADESEVEAIGPGATKTATWTLTETGEYQLGCHVPGHYEAGMVQTFTVVASASAPGPAQLPVAGGTASSPIGWMLAGLALLVTGLAVRHRLARGK